MKLSGLGLSFRRLSFDKSRSPDLQHQTYSRPRLAVLVTFTCGSTRAAALFFMCQFAENSTTHVMLQVCQEIEPDSLIGADCRECRRFMIAICCLRVAASASCLCHPEYFSAKDWMLRVRVISAQHTFHMASASAS